MPDSPPSTVVPGDYRLGNVMISRPASLCDGVPRLLEVAVGYL